MDKRKIGKVSIIGLTGGICCGKTTVARYLGCRGAVIIDADRIYHRLIRPKTDLYRSLVRAFGRRIISHGKIDRRKLGALAFADKRSLKKLKDLTHPRIINEIRSKIGQAKRRGGRRLVVIDAPLLIESGFYKAMDYVLVVKCAHKVQLKRCAKKSGFNKRTFNSIIKNQLPLKKKISFADYVIDNSGTLEYTRKQLKDFLQGLAERAN